MLENTIRKNVSKRMVQPVLKYIDDVYGQETTDLILKEINHDRLYFDDLNGYMPLEITEELFNSAVRHTGDHSFPYTMGRNVFRYLPRLQGMMVLAFSSPMLIFKNIEKLEQNIVKTTCVNTTSIGPNKFKLRIFFKDNYREPASACRNRHGTYEAVPTFFGLPYAHVEHPRCAFRGDPYCEYIVTVPESQSHWYFKAALGTLAAAAVSGIFWIFCKNLIPAILSLILLPVSLYLFIYFLQKRFRQTMKWVNEAGQMIKKNNEDLRKETERTAYLHDLTVELNRAIRTEVICKCVSEFLTKNFKYDSAQIWLTDQGDRFYCAGTCGLNKETKDIIYRTEYSITEGMHRPEGFVYKVLKNRETLLINDFKKATINFTEQSQQLFTVLGASSVIIIPLSENNKAFGMLVGINNGEKKVSYTDKILFEALTHIVSNSLFKARLFESMENKIKKRDEEIRRRQKQVLLTKEMTIQNEKLSALGQMAAGIAHEINNPLNFLVNIFPDLKRDFYALKRITLLLRQHLQGRDNKELEGILNDNQLESHLEENEAVFEYIEKCLERARKTANSLKVFARSAEKETVSLEKLGLLVDQVIDLIPVKNRAGIEIRNTINPALELKINRIEFQQVLVSLITNSIEAMSNQGTIILNADKTGPNLIINVLDEGTGISEEHSRSIFQPFFTTKDTQLHTGLGLNISREIVKKYGGHITFSSRQPSGTIFSIHFKNEADVSHEN